MLNTQRIMLCVGIHFVYSKFNCLYFIVVTFWKLSNHNNMNRSVLSSFVCSYARLRLHAHSSLPHFNSYSVSTARLSSRLETKVVIIIEEWCVSVRIHTQCTRRRWMFAICDIWTFIFLLLFFKEKYSKQSRQYDMVKVS